MFSAWGGPAPFNLLYLPLDVSFAVAAPKLHSEYQKHDLNMELKTRQIMAAALPEMPTRM